jgi:hypothetical protein
MRTLIIAATFVVLAAPAFAQDITAEQRAACKGDYEKFCSGTIPGGGRIIACLKKNEDKLTAACKKMVEAQK